ncbi:hypothetical protein [Ewingella americana]|uniref:Uncharacterized protein n=1 Tax=Ewingella americana TaxID=41202 RepID=A0A502GH98_9GAMM|nr:hypothetical protein [Ewingella americana]TPG60103.1 hypothetical protein EAH77_16170 [Ewingella americana]
MTKIHVLTGLNLKALTDATFKLKDLVECLEFIPEEILTTRKLKELFGNDLEKAIAFKEGEEHFIVPEVSEFVITDHLYRRLQHFFDRKNSIAIKEISVDASFFTYPVAFIQAKISATVDPVEPPVDPVEPPVDPVDPVDPPIDPIDPIDPPINEEPVIDPNPESSEPEASNVTYNAKTSFVNGGGNLLAGSGNPAGGFALATDNVLEIGLGARIFNNKALPAGDNGQYAIELNATDDWAIPISVGLLDTTKTTEITSEYDVLLTFFGDATGAETGTNLVLALAKTDAGYEWADEARSYVISDNAANKAGSATQNIQRYSFFPQIVTPALEEGVTIPTGTFKVKLAATHKATGKVMTTEIVATVTKAA